MADWQSISAAATSLVVGIAFDPNGCGPFYHGGFAYYFYPALDSSATSPTFARIGCSKTQNGSTWTQVGAATTPKIDCSGQQFSWFSCDDYDDGAGNHVLYAVVPDGPLSDIPHRQMYVFDFVTGAWSYVGDWGASAQSDEATVGFFVPDSGVFHTLPVPVASVFLVRVQKSTGVVYLFYNGSTATQSCVLPNGDITTYQLGNCGYNTWNGTFGAYFGLQDAPAPKGGIIIGGAYVSSDTVFVWFYISSTISSRTAFDCDCIFAPVNGLEFASSGMAIVGFGSHTYVFNNLGCPYFLDPNFIGSQNVPGDTLAVAFGFTPGFLATSQMVEIDGNLYLAIVSPNRTLAIYAIFISSGSVSGVIYIDSGKKISVANGFNYGGASSYGNNLQLIVKDGNLYVFWRHELYKNDGASSWVMQGITKCGDGGFFEYNYSPTSLQLAADYGFAKVNLLTCELEDVQRFTKQNLVGNTGSFAAGIQCYMMPITIPSGGGGSHWNTGDIVPIISQGVSNTLCIPDGGVFVDEGEGNKKYLPQYIKRGGAQGNG